jgi:hypothetical protein
MLLHYLDKPMCRGDPDRYCRLHHLTSSLWGNWVKTKELVNRAIERGWVAKEGDSAYRITESGGSYLLVLRKVYEEWDPNRMARYLERER